MVQRHGGRWNMAFCDGRSENGKRGQFFKFTDDNVVRLWNRTISRTGCSITRDQVTGENGSPGSTRIHSDRAPGRHLYPRDSCVSAFAVAEPGKTGRDNAVCRNNLRQQGIGLACMWATLSLSALWNATIFRAECVSKLLAGASATLRRR